MIATEQFLYRANHRSSRHAQDLPPQLSTWAKWRAIALVLLPGSFVVLALLWLYRCRARASIPPHT
jgi:hypothetical protein